MWTGLTARPAFWFGVLLNAAGALFNLVDAGRAMLRHDPLTVPLLLVTVETLTVYGLVFIDRWGMSVRAEHQERLRDLEATTALHQLVVDKMQRGELTVQGELVQNVSGRRDH